MNRRLTGGQALVEALQRWGIETLFGVPGVHLDSFFDALYPVRDTIQVIHARHEQGAAYMALGHAMATGRPGVFVVVPGPGFLNTGAALATAYACSAPVLCITSTVILPLLDKNYGVLHELPDQPGVISRLTKWSARANHAAEIPELADEALRQMLSGRPRPVALEIPPEILGQSCQMRIPDRIPTLTRPCVDPGKVGEAADLLANAKQPLIVVGGGAQSAAGEILKLAEILQAPVMSRQMGRGVVSDRHRLSIVASAGQTLWKTADVVVGIGTRLQLLREWGADEDLKVVRIDIDPTETDRVAPPQVAIVADASEAAETLARALLSRDIHAPDRSDELGKLRSDFHNEIQQCIPRQAAYIHAIRAALPDDGVVVDEITQVGHVTKLVMPTYHPRTLITSGYQGTLGYGFATALGAQNAAPEKKVISINGDGGFMYTMPELATAVLHHIPLVAVIFNDGSYGNVEAIQKRWYGGRVIATNLFNPDFVTLAKSFGVLGFRARNPEELSEVLPAAFEAPGPVIVEVPVTVDEMGWPWDMIMRRKIRG